MIWEAWALVRPDAFGAAVQFDGKVKVFAPVTVIVRDVEVLFTVLLKVPFVTPLMQTLWPVL